MAQNFLNFLCRYLESFTTVVVDDGVLETGDDEIDVEVATEVTTCWSRVDDFELSTLFVQLLIVVVAADTIVSFFAPPGSSLIELLVSFIAAGDVDKIVGFFTAVDFVFRRPMMMLC